VQSFCDAERFDYGLPGAYNLRPTDPHRLVRSVRERVCFLVAVRAHGRGVFALDEGMPDRRVLRDAVERDVERVGARVRSWPSEFADAREAAAYVEGEAARGGFEYACFESVGEERFVGYVTWNVARRAWEDGRFEMGRVPRAWVRKVSKEKVKETEKEKAKGSKEETLTGTSPFFLERADRNC
jgi:hypothetical protein